MNPIAANPHVFTHLKTDPRSIFTVLVDTGGVQIRSNAPFFTADETAEIAKAYLAAYLKEQRARLHPDSEHKKAEANLRAWRKRFKDWQNAT